MRSMEIPNDDRLSPQPDACRRRLTWRAFFIGVAFVVYFGVGGPGGHGGFHLPPGSLFVLVILVGIFNPVARRLGLRTLSPSELGLIWAMVLVGLLSGGMAAYLPPSIAGPRYFASAENQWARLLHRYLPSWLFVSDPEAIRTFYEGLPEGARTPWRLWLSPVLMWFILGFAFYAMMALGAVILRRQWVEHERLSFPIVQLPAELALDAGGIPGRRPILTNRLLWLGFAVAAGFHTINNLHAHFPVVPFLARDIPIPLWTLPRPWNQAHPIYLFMIPTAIGFAYLLPTEVSLSFWFFFLFARLEAVVGGALGFAMPYSAGYMARTFLSHQEFGAFLAVAGAILYAARGHLRTVWHTAVRRDGADRDEPVSYRLAVFGFLGAAIAAAIWFVAAGLPALLAAVVILVFFGICLVGSWAIAAGGVLFLQNAFGPTRIFVTAVGSQALTPSGLTMLKIPEQVFMSDLRSLEMPNFFNGLRAADDVRARRSAVFWGMIAALVVGVVASMTKNIWSSYRYGALTYGSNWANIQAAQIPGRSISTWLQAPADADPFYLLWIATGAGTVAALFWLRARYVGWPLHPIGFTIASSYAIYVLWFPFFVGWLIKGLVVRYSGLRGFLLLRPAFLGLILGDCVSGAVWGIVTYFTHAGFPLWPG
ncbi:MAG: hypothetical protein JSV65_18000 [Armatimonadota bacterium]|nr:MAG: hypothetical protein JSV65_18000 [Armatimonadota bacterium]